MRSILLVDDHEVARAGLKCYLDGYTVCGEASNGNEAVEMVAVLRPDLVLMDISMPVMNGLDATREIRRASPSTKIILFSTHLYQHIHLAVKDAGAHGYAEKTGNIEDLLKMIRLVLEDLTTFPVP